MVGFCENCGDPISEVMAYQPPHARTVIEVFCTCHHEVAYYTDEDAALSTDMGTDMNIIKNRLRRSWSKAGGSTNEENPGTRRGNSVTEGGTGVIDPDEVWDAVHDAMVETFEYAVDHMKETGSDEFPDEMRSVLDSILVGHLEKVKAGDRDP